MYLWIKLDNDAMFQCLWEKKMKTNMSHTGGKLTGTNGIKHIPRRSKSIICRYFSVQVSTLPSDIPRGHCGRQRPPLSREPPSVWPASLLIDQGAPGWNHTGRLDLQLARRKFEWKKHELQITHNHSELYKPNISRTFSSLSIWNDGEWWQLLVSAGKSLEPPWPLVKALNLGCPGRSAEKSLSNENDILHNVAQEQCKHTLAGIGNSLGIHRAWKKHFMF